MPPLTYLASTLVPAGHTAVPFCDHHTMYLQLRRLELASLRLAQFTPRLAQALSGLTHLSCSGAGHIFAAGNACTA